MGFEHVDMFRPPMPLWLVTAAVVAAGIGAVWMYRHGADRMGWPRRALLLLLRLLVLAALAWVLAGPSVFQSAGPVMRRPSVVLLADTSASMAERDVAKAKSDGEGLQTRWQAIAERWLAPEYLQSLDKYAAVQVRRFDRLNQLMAKGPIQMEDPTGEQTRLFAALDQLVVPNEGRSNMPDVLVVLSDGHDTERSMNHDVIERLRTAGTRVFAVPVGQVKRSVDLSLQVWADADVLYAGQSTAIYAEVIHRGLEGRTARVSLFHAGQLVDAREVTFDDRLSQQVQFNVTPPDPAPQFSTVEDYELRVRLLPDEQTSDLNDANASKLSEPYLGNNQRHVFLQITRKAHSRGDVRGAAILGYAFSGQSVGA